MPKRDLVKILYAEDEPDIQAIARLALENVGGFTVCVCNNGKEALNKMDEFDPDMILLDVMMPDMDGPTTLKEIQSRAHLNHKPVVFMTAKVQPQEIDHYRQLGAADIITKPFDPMELANTIKEVWARCSD